jgi:hypothetical protein
VARVADGAMRISPSAAKVPVRVERIAVEMAMT